MNGPFFSDRDISYLYRLAVRLTATTHNILVGFLVFAGLVAQCGFAPRALRTGQTNRLAPFTTTVRMIARCHCGTADGRADALVALATGFTKFDIAMIEIADLTNRCVTDLPDQADFTGRHTHLCKITFLGE